MSCEHTQRYIESLIEDYDELRSNWNGKDLKTEAKLMEMEAELIELGIEIEEVNEYLDRKESK